MKRTSLAFLTLLLAAPSCGYASEQLIPAGSLIQCTVSEPKLSSKTTAIGDPVLCQLGHAERYGRSVLPYDSYLVGRFEDYKDPGHFVGKGWMELRFDRMVIEPDTVIPVDARVVAVPGYNVDRDGRILGKGHAVRDAVLWSIPILWPVDLIMLPLRGPRPTLKEETRLTLKVMDDLAIPDTPQPQRDPYGFTQRPPVAENTPPSQMDQQPEPPAMADYAPQEPPAPVYAAPPPPVYAYAPPPPPVYAYAPAPPSIYAYGGSAVIGVYGGGVRAYGYGGGPAYRSYRPAPRPYGYAGPTHSYGYAGAQRGYATAPGGYGRGYGYGNGGQARMSAGVRSGGAGIGRAGR